MKVIMLAETARPPLQSFFGRTVNGFLSGCGGVNGGHQAFRVPPKLSWSTFVIGAKTVGRAGSVRYKLFAFWYMFFSFTPHTYMRVSSFEGADMYYILGTCCNMPFGFLFGKEQTGGFHYVIGSDFTPFQVGRIGLASNTHQFFRLLPDCRLLLRWFPLNCPWTVSYFNIYAM